MTSKTQQRPLRAPRRRAGDTSEHLDLKKRGVWVPAVFRPAGKKETHRVWVLAERSHVLRMVEVEPHRTLMRYSMSHDASEWSPNTRNIAFDRDEWDEAPAFDADFATDVDEKKKAIVGLEHVKKRAESEQASGSAGSSGLCTICTERSVCVSFAPCTHLAACATCAVTALAQKPACVICRAEVESVSLHHVQTSALESVVRECDSVVATST